MFNTFDAPSGEFCLAQRESSNTPLQALSLLNDTVILEAAEAMGEQLASTPGHGRGTDRPAVQIVPQPLPLLPKNKSALASLSNNNVNDSLRVICRQAHCYRT